MKWDSSDLRSYAGPRSLVWTSAADSSGARTSAPLTQSLWASAGWRGSGTPSVRVFAPVWCKAEVALGFSSGTMHPPAAVFAEDSVPQEGRIQNTSLCLSLEGRGGCLLSWSSHRWSWAESGWRCCSTQRSWRVLSSVLQSGIHKAVGRALGAQWVCPCQESWCRRRMSALSCCPQSWTGMDVGESTLETAPWSQPHSAAVAV